MLKYYGTKIVEECFHECGLPFPQHCLELTQNQNFSQPEAMDSDEDIKSEKEDEQKGDQKSDASSQQQLTKHCFMIKELL
jgi:hypothetical protein